MLPFPVTFAPQPNHSPIRHARCEPKTRSTTCPVSVTYKRLICQLLCFHANTNAWGCRPPDTGAGSTWSPRNKLLPKAGIAPVRRITEVRQAADPLPPDTPCARAYLLRVFAIMLRKTAHRSGDPFPVLWRAGTRVRALLAARAIKRPGCTAPFGRAVLAARANKRPGST